MIRPWTQENSSPNVRDCLPKLSLEEPELTEKERNMPILFLWKTLIQESLVWFFGQHGVLKNFCLECFGEEYVISNSLVDLIFFLSFAHEIIQIWESSPVTFWATDEESKAKGCTSVFAEIKLKLSWVPWHFFPHYTLIFSCPFLFLNMPKKLVFNILSRNSVSF